MKSNTLLISILVVITAIVYRFVPAFPNFSPITALFVFGGAVFFKNRLSLPVLLSLVYLSDLVLNNTVLRSFYPSTDGIILFPSYLLFTFVSYILIYFVGKAFGSKSFSRAIGGGILGSIVFFLITNAGCWIIDPTNLYDDGINGLLSSYTAALPFFKTSLLADLVFVSIFFGAYHLSKITSINFLKQA